MVHWKEENYFFVCHYACKMTHHILSVVKRVESSGLKESFATDKVEQHNHHPENDECMTGAQTSKPDPFPLSSSFSRHRRPIFESSLWTKRQKSPNYLEAEAAASWQSGLCEPVRFQNRVEGGGVGASGTSCSSPQYPLDSYCCYCRQINHGLEPYPCIFVRGE